MTKILFITAELFPLVKTGGLGDYSEALPRVLNKDKEIDIKVMIPGYPKILKAAKKTKIIVEGRTLLQPSKEFKILESRIAGLPFPILIVSVPELFEREGNPYTDDLGEEWSDNFDRFASLSMMPYMMMLYARWKPDIVHANDWHTGLYSAYLSNLERRERPKTIFTIHNIAFQGNYPHNEFLRSGLPHYLYNINQLEFFYKMSFLKAGINLSDKVLTVSPQYANETSTTSHFGGGFEGILASKGNDYQGILNGVDYRIWSPTKDSNLEYNYKYATIEDKVKQKRYFQKQYGLAVDKKKLLISSVSRLSNQKGLDMLYKVLERLIPEKKMLQFVGIGTGDDKLEKQFQALSEKYPKQVKFFCTYDEVLAHQAIGSSDAFVMPSRFEPCGLTQIYALKYGTLPIVTPVGGLLDTVVHYQIQKNKVSGTGFITNEVSTEAVEESILQALEVFSVKIHWQKIVRNAMRQNFGWDKSANKYKLLYQEMLGAFAG